MSASHDVAAMLGAARRLVALLEAPEPGLASWHLSVGLMLQQLPTAPPPDDKRGQAYRRIGYTEGVRDAALLVDDDAGVHTSPWLVDQILNLLLEH